VLQLPAVVSAQRHDIQAPDIVQVQGRPALGLGSRIPGAGGRRRGRVVQQGQAVQGTFRVFLLQRRSRFGLRSNSVF